EMLAFLRQSFERNDNSLVLFQYCQLLAQQSEWTKIAELAQQLTDKVGTAEALRLALIGAFRAHRFELCIDLLSSHQAFFPGGKLPSDLRSLRVECLLAL